MAETSEWSNEAVVQLVKEYERRPQLWAREHNLYRAQAAKHAAWQAIADQFACNLPDLRKKFNSVLASHRRERMKEKETGRSNWFLYPNFKFLRNYMRHGLEDDDKDEMPSDSYEQTETLEQFNTSDVDETAANVDAEDQEMTLIIKEEPERVTAVPLKEFMRSRHGRKRLMKTIRRKPTRGESNLQSNQPIVHNSKRQFNQSTDKETFSKAYVDSRLLELQIMMKKETRQKKDDCDTYGEYISSTLRKHTKKRRCLIKQAINNILFEQEMNEYENPLGSDNNMEEEALEESDG